jgi:hypothetical protein
MRVYCISIAEVRWSFRHRLCAVCFFPQHEVTSKWAISKWDQVNCNKNKLRGLSPQANYTDRATAACRRSYCQLRGCCVVKARDPHGRILGFLDRSRYYFFQVAPQLYSRGSVDPVPDPLLLRKSGSPGNRTRYLWNCSQELWPLDHRGGVDCNMWG